MMKLGRRKVSHDSSSDSDCDQKTQGKGKQLTEFSFH